MSRGKMGYYVLVKNEWVEEVEKLVKLTDSRLNRYHWASVRGNTKVEISSWGKEQLFVLEDFLKGKADAGDKGARRSQKAVQQFIEMSDNPAGARVSKFENLAQVIKGYVALSENRWVFISSGDDNLLPWFVSDVGYHPSCQYSPAHVVVSMIAFDFANDEKTHRTKTVSFVTGDFKSSLTAKEYMDGKGLYLASDALLSEYRQDMEKHMGYYSREGLLVNVSGKAYLNTGWRYSGYRAVERSGSPAKMVIDSEEIEFPSSAQHCAFWDNNEETVWEIPVHPLLRCFDLEEHAEYKVHVNNVETYVYDVSCGEKLVLPGDVKSFIEILVQHSKSVFRDIVGGKEGGTILLMEGPPGTGKTLTAEIYSEVMERPLYKVQSSQLGVTPTDVEKQLKRILHRAERWGAILLIDEADVYIHARGNDMIQNAIVGVFLRVLEYYRGVLFMTTNRGTVIDDAIVSRLTARFRYENPNKDEQFKLWTVLSRENNIELDSVDIKHIIQSTAMPCVSGRDIKNLLKLALVSNLGRNHLKAADIFKVVKFRHHGEVLHD